MSKFAPSRRNDPNGPQYFTFECPGCGYDHWIKTSGPGPVWAFNNDLERPTVSPSILVNGASDPTDSHGRCHSFIRDGQIQFLSDCFHKLAGQTVPLPDAEQWDISAEDVG